MRSGKRIGLSLVMLSALLSACAKQQPATVAPGPTPTTVVIPPPPPVLVPTVPAAAATNPAATTQAVAVAAPAPAVVVARPVRTAVKPIDAFIQFDRAFVPTLVLIEQNKASLAGKAFAMLKDQWRVLRGGLSGTGSSDGVRQRELGELDYLIEQAEQMLTGGRLSTAQIALEQVREHLTGVRQRDGIEYYVDHLNRYMAAMHQMVSPVIGKRSGELSEEEIGTIRAGLAAGKRLWRRLEQAKFDAGSFGFDEPKVAEMQHLIQVETWALENLQQALQSGKQDQIIPAALAIRPAVARLYMMFGQFPAKDAEQAGMTGNP